jgi:hypothetical protein
MWWIEQKLAHRHDLVTGILANGCSTPLIIKMSLVSMKLN